MAEHYNIIILGSGPAGFTAGIYSSRANRTTLILEGPEPGGQLTTTTDVENFPGFENGIQGPEMMDIFRRQAQRFGTKTVFEVTSEELGAQKAFLAGGRYDNLVEEMGGPSTPGIGFGAGVERLTLLMSTAFLSDKPSCFFAYMGEKAGEYLVPLLKSFAKKEIPLNYSYEGKSLKSQMRYADSLHADFVLILGDDEIENNTITLRNMNTKRQYGVVLNAEKIPDEILRLISE